MGAFANAKPVALCLASDLIELSFSDAGQIFSVPRICVEERCSSKNVLQNLINSGSVRNQDTVGRNRRTSQ